MIKNLYLSAFLLFSISGSAQIGAGSEENYTYTKSCLTEDCSKKTESITYYDGLSRPKQAIAIAATPSGKDIVSHIEYDALGRQVKSYLPIPQAVTQNGILYINPLSNASSVYGSEKIYAENVMEGFPQNRVSQSYGTGNAWNGKATAYSYLTNQQNEVVKYTTVTAWSNNTSSPSLIFSGYYPAGVLNKNTITDPDNNTTTEFRNGKGQILMIKKSSVTGEKSETYYVYDEYDMLVYVVSPLAVKANENLASGAAVPTNTLNELCYQYKYDTKFRTVEKKLPGKGWEYIVYDKQNRVVMTRDTNMKESGEWLFTKYDKLGRVLYTGIATGGERQDEQLNVYTKGLNNEERTASPGFTAGTMTVYYTNSGGYPAAFQKILSIHYYDTYPEGTPTIPTQILNQNVLMQDPSNSLISTKGLSTASFVKNIEDDNWTKSYIWYDTKARSVGSYTENHLGGYTKTEMMLDFAGIVQQTKVYHKRLATDNEKIIVQNFEYDSKNRLKKQWHQVNANAQELLAENTYNELSQLINKKVGNNLQSIDYTYDVRGSLKKVNDPVNLNGKLFAYEMKNTAPVNTIAMYNGTITEVDWKTSSDNVLRRYSYQYDGLGRLKKGIYAEPNASVPENGFYNETLSYDDNNNITSLQRNGKNSMGAVSLIDNLSYSYTGNTLKSVTDSSTDYAGYPDVSGNTIAYDNNGNMKDHQDKGILQIDYNFLNMPDYLKFNTGLSTRTGRINENTSYLYRADGAKLRKVYNYAPYNPLGTITQLSSKVTEYLDGFQYEGDGKKGLPSVLALKFIPTSEGYYNFENNQYIYSYTDHLGNVRVSYSKNSSGSAEVLEENNFYPFGMKHEGYNQTTGNPAYTYGYNGKELQKETGWSDYGARMYMCDIGRWGVIDPLAETSRRFTPYNYAYNNPVMFIDPDGRKAVASTSYSPDMYSQTPAPWSPGTLRGGVAAIDELFAKLEKMERDSQTEVGGGSSPTEIGIYGKFAQAAFDLLKESMKGQLNLTFKNGIVSGSAVEGVELSEAAKMLLEAIKNPDIKVRLETIFGFRYYDANLKTDVFALGDGFKGSFVYNGKVTATNVVSPEVTKGFDKALGSPEGVSLLHAILESYSGALYFPGAQGAIGNTVANSVNDVYIFSHGEAACIDPRYKDLPSNMGIDKKTSTDYNTKRVIGESVSIYNIYTGAIIYNFGSFKY